MSNSSEPLHALLMCDFCGMLAVGEVGESGGVLVCAKCATPSLPGRGAQTSESLAAERDRAERAEAALREIQSACREAIGVPESQHTRERMERIATAHEEALTRADKAEGDLMRLMETARGIDPSASAPSLEALLVGTEFADALPSAARTREVEVAPIPATGNETKSHNTDDTFLNVSGGEGNLDRDTAEVHLRIYSPNSDYQFAQAWFRVSDILAALGQIGGQR